MRELLLSVVCIVFLILCKLVCVIMNLCWGFSSSVLFNGVYIYVTYINSSSPDLPFDVHVHGFHCICVKFLRVEVIRIKLFANSRSIVNI